MTSSKHLNNVYLGLGSNLGDKAENIASAIKHIEKRIGNLVSLSALFITKPVGFQSENLFINAACHIATDLSLIEVLDQTQAIEREMGRDKKSVNKAYSDRIIDIDILLYNNLIYTDKRVTIPHPFMHERDFVLSPLKEVAADVLHPILKRRIKEL